MFWQIFTHSVRMITNNLSVALRIALVPTLLAVCANSLSNYFFYGKFIPDFIGNEEMINAGLSAMFGSIFLLVSIILPLWVVVGWHRYVLLNETPTGYFSSWNGTELVGYFWRIILIHIIAIISFIPFLFLIALVFILGGDSLSGVHEFLRAFGMFLNIFLFCVLFMIVLLRVSLILPAAAIGKNLKIKQAWEKTKSASLTIFGAYLLLLLCMLIALLLFSASMIILPSLFIIILSICFQIFFTLLSASLLTTLYGYYIEGRDLNG